MDLGSHIIADTSWQTFSDFRYMELIKHRVIARARTKGSKWTRDEVEGGQGEKGIHKSKELKLRKRAVAIEIKIKYMPHVICRNIGVPVRRDRSASISKAIHTGNGKKKRADPFKGIHCIYHFIFLSPNDRPRKHTLHITHKLITDLISLFLIFNFPARPQIAPRRYTEWLFELSGVS